MLSDKDKARLDFERQWFKYPGAKAKAIHDRFGESPTRYYQVLNVLIDTPEALEYDPMLVRRLTMNASRNVMWSTGPSENRLDWFPAGRIRRV